MMKKIILLLLGILALTVSCISAPSNVGTNPIPTNTDQASSVPNSNPGVIGNNSNSGSSSQPYAIGIKTCNRVSENQWMGIGTNGVNVSPGWKGYQCPIWVYASTNIGLKMNNLFLSMSGIADFSKQVPYQQGDFFVVTTDNVKYPVDLETMEYGYVNDFPVFPGVAVTGKFFDPSAGDIAQISPFFGFLIPETMTAKYIVYTKGDQQINIPTDGQAVHMPEIQGNYITQLPFSITLDQYITVQISNPTLTPYENGMMFSLSITGSNNDTTANQNYIFPIGMVDSNGVFWGQNNCVGSLGPSQTTENQCNVAPALYSADQLPDAIYFGIDGSNQTFFFKLANNQIAH
jgi:hypothetical protein